MMIMNPEAHLGEQTPKAKKSLLAYSESATNELIAVPGAVRRLQEKNKISDSKGQPTISTMSSFGAESTNSEDDVY